uniref:Probable DNA polymerase n=1 Tax=Candida corydali TaxID=391826 RepID=S5TF86_9ASCO|nr:hypothetical protein [Candida corydali]AGS44529.1 hypothetical protein [Candida corydali]
MLWSQVKQGAVGYNPNIGSFDIEPGMINNNVVPISLGFSVFNNSNDIGRIISDIDTSIYDVYNYMKDKYSDYEILEYSNQIVIDCIKAMFKYNKYTFYCHNFGKYDCIFLLARIIKYNEAYPEDPIIYTPLYRDNVVIKLSLKYHYKGKTSNISILDSYLLLNSSLRKLALSYNVEELKGLFPYSFLNYSTLNYIGPTPDKYYFSNISQEEYDAIYIESNYSIKDELHKYLTSDLRVHLMIMDKFRQQLYLLERQDMTKSITISRLSLNAFKSMYNKAYSSIPNIDYNKNGIMYNFIKNTLFGDITTVYKPYGENLNYYDINSFYPYSALNPMPSRYYKYISYINGIDITTIKDVFNFDNHLGFFYASVEAPEDLPFGLLPYRKDDGSVIYPLGKFKGSWTSPELELAIKNGYKITIYYGYIFDKVDTYFKDYIEHLYKAKERSTGTEISLFKSLLNNFLGRFGMRQDKGNTYIVNKELYDLLNIGFNVKGMQQIHDKYLINTDLVPKPSKSLNIPGFDYSNYMNDTTQKLKENSIMMKRSQYSETNVAITSLVNAYARVYLNTLKLALYRNGYTLYYCDTDSLVIDKELPAEGEVKVVNNILDIKHDSYNKRVWVKSKDYKWINTKPIIL